MLLFSSSTSLLLVLLAISSPAAADPFFGVFGGGNKLDDRQKPLKSPSQPVKDIPHIGLGLWNSKAERAQKSVKYAFKAGYHHFDSAAAYSNEDYVGQAFNASSAPDRDTYWVTSKLWNDMHKPANVGVALNQTLADLQLDHLDLYLMHWPVAFLPDQKPGRTIIDEDTSLTDTWRAMEALVSRNLTRPEPGTTRFIGVSNFSPRQLDQILAMCTVCPYAHEFETHPYLQQAQFVSWHADRDIRIIAYSPLANLNPTYKDKFPELPPITEDKFWVDLAAQKNVTAAQAVLAWGLARDTIVIPKSTHEDYIRENLGAAKIKFTDDEMKAITEQDKRARFNNPSKAWGVDLFEGLDGGSSRFL